MRAATPLRGTLDLLRGTFPTFPTSVAPTLTLTLVTLLTVALVGPPSLEAQPLLHGLVQPQGPLQSPVQLTPSPFPGFWQESELLQGQALPGTGGSACEDGVLYDDGELDRPVGDQDESFLTLAMAFDVEPGSKVEEVCVCWTRTGDVDLHEYELLFFADDGPNGSPGSQLGLVFPSVDDVPAAPGSRFHTVDVSEADVLANSGRIYIAAEWFPGLGDEFFLCGDTDGGGNQPLFLSTDQGVTWSDLREVEAEDPDIPDELDALMIRAQFSPPDVGPPPGPCVPGPTTLCLQDDRFRVEVAFATPQGGSGLGRPELLTPDTGYFWFFNEENVELVIKVLDACSFADRFWVFAGGLTNVETEITVTDTERDLTAVFRNPQGQAFLPLQDTVTFNTCP